MTFDTPNYYDNSKGSLYKLGQERNWNNYIFDVVKRLSRNGNKDSIILEIDKSIFVLKLYKQEINPKIISEDTYDPIDRDWPLKLKILIRILETNDIENCIKILEDWKENEQLK